MTSSQALTINLFGPLTSEADWLVTCLNTWLGRSDLTHIVEIEIEFAPVRRSLHLNDQTRIDVLAVVMGARGKEVVAVEVKYADRFSSRRVNIATPPYLELAQHSGLWRFPRQVLAESRTNQLARVHALATSYGASIGVRNPGSLLVLTHELDVSAAAIVNQYRSRLNGPWLRHVSLRDAMQSVVSSSPPGRHLDAENLQLRYGSEAASLAVDRTPRRESHRPSQPAPRRQSAELGTGGRG